MTVICLLINSHVRSVLNLFPFSVCSASSAVNVLSILIVLAGCASTVGTGSEGEPSTPSGFVRRVAPFRVIDENGAAYAHPFLGGLDVPRPQFIDIDGDGDLDLFVQERLNEVMFFENTGDRQRATFIWRTDRFQDLEVGEWNRFVDLDGDGDYDLLAERPFSYIRYFRNDGNRHQPKFIAAVDSVKDPDGAPIFADRQNIPNLVDIDCNGRPDLFLGRVDGTITRYEQTARTGEPVFRLITDRFENIEIIGQVGGSFRHGANSMAFADIDGDGDPDFFWGDYFEPGVLFIENTGACPAPDLTRPPQPLRAATDSIRTSGYNVPVLADIDADGDLDLFVGVLGGAFNPARTASDNFYFYERVDGILHRRTTRYLSTVDVGSESMPAMADLDGDGDLDLVIGNKLDPRKLESARLYVFRNDGSARAPTFRLADTLDLAPSFHYAPAFGDLDADGDLDLMLGTWNDGVRLFRNEGDATQFRFVADTSVVVQLTRGSNSAPALVDIDGDGDLDLFVGEASGQLNFYRNTGTPQRPVFTLESDAYGGIDVGRRSVPVFVDIDRDGDYDLLLGREEGGVVLYRNVGTRREPVFTEDPSFTLPLPPLSTPLFADLDGDGDLDVLSGASSGGLVYFENRAGARGR